MLGNDRGSLYCQRNDQPDPVFTTKARSSGVSEQGQNEDRRPAPSDWRQMNHTAAVPVNSDGGSGFWKGSAGILGEMQHAADGDVGLRFFPNKIDGEGETIDSGEAMERTALPEDLRHPRDQVQARFDTTKELVPETRALRFIPLERFPQIGLGAGRDGERVDHRVKLDRRSVV